MEENSKNQAENTPSKKKKKMKYKTLNTKNWGIDYMKNEYKEIILSNSNHPEKM